jgi:fatty acid desaturase
MSLPPEERLRHAFWEGFRYGFAVVGGWGLIALSTASVTELHGWPFGALWGLLCLAGHEFLIRRSFRFTV